MRSPKSLALSGRVADGTILAEYAAPAYVHWAGEQIENGVQSAGHDRKHHMTVFALACVGKTAAAAREQVRPLVAKAIASGKIDAQLRPMGILPQVHALLKSRDLEQFEAEIPNVWIDHLAIVGTAEDWELAIDRLVASGADTVVLVPLPHTGLDELKCFANHFLGGRHR